jgi:hypothetical protein
MLHSRQHPNPTVGGIHSLGAKECLTCQNFDGFSGLTTVVSIS